MIDSVSESAGAAPDLKKTRRRRTGGGEALKTDRLPPHSPEAEAGVLGCVLLSPNDCMGQCIEKLKAGSEVFYDLRHQTIYGALAEMYDRREAIDVITLQQQLKDRQLLDQVGGIPYLSSLQDAVPSAANLEYYLDIVLEKFFLRKMIHTCTDVVSRVYDYEGDVETLLDDVEKEVLQINESREQAGTRPVKQLVQSAIGIVENYFSRQGTISGVPTGFLDLDKMTDGLHGGEMIVVAARPSMGKCLAADSEIVLADGSMATIEEIYRRRTARLLTLGDDWKILPTGTSDFVDDGLKPVFRVTTRLGRVVETTLPHPFRTIRGWQPLGELKAGDAVAVPRVMTVFGTDARRECEVKLLAYLLGDGCLTHSSPTFTNGSARMRQEFADAAAEFGGVTTREYDSRGTRTKSLRVVTDPDALMVERTRFGNRLSRAIRSRRISARQVALGIGASPSALHQWCHGRTVPDETHWRALCATLEVEPATLAPAGLEAISVNRKSPVSAWLESLELLGADSHVKFIPPFVFRLPRKQMALFLNRLFATDGWATVLKRGPAQLGYASVSRRLAQQVQHLLLRFGIIASLRRRAVKYDGQRRTGWQLDITDAQAIETFATEIGIFGKETALESVRRALAGKRRQTNVDLIPAEIWPALAAAKGNESWSSLARRAGIRGHTNIHVGRRGLSRARLAVFARALKSPELQALAESDVYWDRIVSIEPLGRKQVYDLTVPATHNFIANDICVHNTSLAMNIAENVVLNHRMAVGVFSLEMTAESLVLRMLCSHARVNLRNIREGFMSEQDFPKLTNAAGKLSSAPLFIDDTPGLSILQLRARARRMWQQHEVKLFVIDYLQLLHSTARRSQDNRQQEIADISSGIKSLAKELKVPVIVLSQLNRELEKDKNRKPRLSDLRESGAIEQDADVVGLLYKPSAGDDDEGGAVEEQDGLAVNLLIAKQRNGPTGDVNLTFLKSYTRFESAAKVSSEDVPGE